MSALILPKALKITPYATELVNRACRPVVPEDVPELETLIGMMAQFARDHDGVGLAAPQVGIFLQLAVLLHDPGKIHVLINPEIVNFGGRDLIEVEGCLSLPPALRAQARVKRSEKVTIDSGTLTDPRPRIRTKHEGYAARVIQHEIDHLNGIFFINRVSSLNKDLVLQKHRKWMRKQGREHG